MEKYGFVYIWKDKKYPRYYIGCHWGTEDDGYICSSNWMSMSYKRRPQDFKRRILKRIYTTRNDLLEEEYKWLSLIKDEELKVRYYNVQKHHFGHWTNLSEEEKLFIRKSVSERTKEAMWNPEIREKYLEGLKTRDTSFQQREDVIAKKRAALMGKRKGVKIEGQALENIRKGNKNKRINIEGCRRGGSLGVKTMNSMKVKCVKCGIEGNPGNIGRYHNERCNIV